MKNIIDVNDFELQNLTTLILRGGMMNRSVFIYDNLGNEKVLLENKIVPSLKANEDSFWVYSKSKTFEFSKAPNFSKSNTFIDFFPKYKNESILIGDFKNGDNRYLQARDATGEKIIWEIGFTSTIFLINSQVYLVQFTKDLQKFKLASFDFYTGLPLWQYEIPENKYDWYIKSNYLNAPDEYHKAEIRTIIGANESVLWIMLNNGRILGLNIENGEEVFSIDDAEIYLKDGERTDNAFYISPQLDEQQGKIFELYGNYYNEIDLDSSDKTYTIFDFTAQSQKLGLDNIRYGCHQGDEIYFYESYLHFKERLSHVGIFNRKSKKIIWTSREMGEVGVFNGVNKIDFADNRLYVLDKESTLHIFEKKGV